MKKVKITLDLKTYEKLINLLDKRGGKSLKKEIEKSVEDYKKIFEVRKENSQKAINQRMKNVKEKIKKAVLELKKQGREINNYSVSKKAKISYNTARKYSELIQILKDL